MAVSDCFVSVVAPVHNDSSIVEGFIADVMNTLRTTYSNYELVLVDDGSQDDSVAKITAQLRKEDCIRLIRLSREFGQDIAISAGLDSVIGDFVVVMLPNSDPPQLIPEIVEKVRKGFGIVFGIRKNRGASNLFVKPAVAVFYWYCRKVLRLNLPKNVAVFRVLTRQAVNALVQIKVRCRYLPVLTAHVGYESQGFAYEQINRAGRKDGRSFFAAAALAIDVITATSRHPLRFVTWIGTFAGLLNVLYSLYVISVFLFRDQVAEGWTTQSLQSAGMFFFIFLILTVLSEYIGHILVESENRPLYYILEERNSTVLLADQERKNVVKDSTPEPLQNLQLKSDLMPSIKIERSP